MIRLPVYTTRSAAFLKTKYFFSALTIPSGNRQDSCWYRFTCDLPHFFGPGFMRVFPPYSSFFRLLIRMGASHIPALLGVDRRGLIVQTAVRSVVIIVHPPAFHNIFQFGQIQKQFAIQCFPSGKVGQFKELS